MQATPPSADTVHAVLRAVLARPEFAPPMRSRLSRFLGSIWEHIGDAFAWLLAHLFPNLGAAERLGPTALRILLVMLGAVGALLVWYVARRIAALMRRRAAGGAAHGSPAAAAPVSGEAWEARSAAAARAGRWRDAAIALYFAVVHRLARAGAVVYDDSKTPGDYRREVRRTPSLASSLAPSMDAFVRAYEPLAFGGRAADEGAFGRLRELARALGARG